MMLEIESIPHVTLAQLRETRKQIRARLEPRPFFIKTIACPSRQHEQTPRPAISSPDMSQPAPPPPIPASPTPIHTLDSTPPSPVGAPLTVRRILRETAGFYALSIHNIASHDRHRRLTKPRQIAFYLAKTLTSVSLPEIGRRMGGFDHTTVLHGVRKIDAWRQADETLASDIMELTERLQPGAR